MGVDDAIRRAARDRTSGAAEIAYVVARALPTLADRRAVLAAARVLLRAHPAMAPLWRMLADAFREGGSAASRSWTDRLASEPDAVARAGSWLVPRRAVVLTHSASSTVVAAIRVARKRVRRVVCSESLPGGEGARLARRLSRDGFDTTVVADAEMARASGEADLVLTGADAVTEHGVVNKVGTHLLALAAREAGVPLYAVAGSSKLLPDAAWVPARAPRYDRTPHVLVDGVVCEDGSLGAGAVRRAVRRIAIPDELLRIVR